ncbi:hypothetical protein G9Q38_02130 [Pusillimonas sp. DMV24BSW_D]|uniref:hypothetical protein n=1 Tax=Neopusillimonas aestuarii TaxID=2716226 RepID=UPI0014074E6B|nr:hypothetical protein [Pusillimonas sp. DMV24BSW_D]QIM48060.1 hypothetical protein G9Q38_02130 [Pusillimonas sp. DMV24BSW_D]
MVNSAAPKLIEKNSQLTISVFVSATFVLALYLLFEPRWDTNDDVAMSMVAHGYGIASIGSPNLVFSNVIWGYLVRTVPQINDLLGYSIATIAALVIIGAVIFYTLQKLGLGWLVSLSVLILILARPVLFPQFTINAGLLTVGAIICWHLYSQQGSRQMLLTGCLLAFFGYLVRSYEFLLILLIALPLLPWEKLYKDRNFLKAAAVLLLTISGAVFVDYQAYQGDNWQQFNALNTARAPITDFGAGVLLKKHPEIIASYGYTLNDISLLSSWFFVDPKLADPTQLNAMLQELGPLPSPRHSFMNGWLGIKTLTHPALLPSFLASLLLLLILPNRRLFLTWVVSIAIIFILGILGRPGIIRVYIPILSLLLIAPLFLQGYKTTKYFTQWLVSIVIMVAGLFNTIAVFSESRDAQMVSEEVRRDLQGFSKEAVVVWGSAFPYEYAYPVLRQPESVMAIKLYGLGVLTLAPFSVSYNESLLGRGMVDRLVSENGVPIIGVNHHWNLLNNYCEERLNAFSHEVKNQQHGLVSVSWRRCEKKVTQE